MKYLSLIIDNNTNATDDLYSYKSEDDNVAVGMKVLAPFGMSNKILDGYVVEVFDEMPESFRKYKSIKSIKGTDPDIWLSEEAVNTALWMHTRCICRYIEAIKLFLPSNTPAKRKTKDIFEGIEIVPDGPKALTKEQTEALSKINDAIGEKRHEIFLLHGVTGAGKTEVYLQAMDKCIQSGAQGIILVPEISLTPQTVSRFMNRFGRNAIAVLHSKLTPAQKGDEYRKIANGEVSLVIGARSAIFAPLQNIGLIVLDEEHETSYKSDKSPKYDTVEIAAKRASAHGAALVLGSATPSVADYNHAEEGLFTKLELKERYNKTPLPSVKLVDMREEVRAGNRSLFSRELVREIQRNLDAKKQIILFLNRRGYFSFVSCRECGFTAKCPDCGIAMTYHKNTNALVCHYCGKKMPMPKVCPDCGSKIIGRFGAGTEQVEEKAKELFPDAVIERLDIDSIKAKGSMEGVLKRFGQRKVDMLIGTQLVAKGLDFANVGLVGVISADVTLNIPDFRSSERTYQLVTQAAGRAGRGDEQGKVIVQSYSPDHPALISAARQNYEEFYGREIKMRNAAGYPPFFDIFQIVISHENKGIADDAAKRFAEKLRDIVGKEYIVLGPTAAPINKFNELYRNQIIVKSPRGMRRNLSLLINQLKKEWGEAAEEALLQADINPYSML